MLEFIYKGTDSKLTKAIIIQYPSLSYAHLQGLLRKKDVMLNGKRIKEDFTVVKGDNIRVYTTMHTALTYDYSAVKIIYQDENIIIFNKPKGLETEGEISLTSYAVQLAPNSKACHRLDVNTDGLVIFANTEEVFEEIKKSIENGNIEKYYMAAVWGVPKSNEANIVAYHTKYSEKSLVLITEKHILGSKRIVTNFKVLSSLVNFSILEIKLQTGRTHQIRAHMAFLGHPVLGDGKYCPNNINKKFSYKSQALTAYKLIFNTTNSLKYLNGKIFEINCKLKELI